MLDEGVGRIIMRPPSERIIFRDRDQAPADSLNE